MPRTTPVLLLSSLLCAVGLSTLVMPLGQARESLPARVRDQRPVGNAPGSYANVVEPAMEAVVNVQPMASVRRDRSILDMFRPGGGGEENVPLSSQGSGVIVRREGIILTNAHVVEGANSALVTFSDGRELEARVLGRDQLTDLAVLKVDVRERLPTLEFGNSENLRVGDVVFAIGNPLGLGQTATMGIVSATRRTGLGIAAYEDFIQTDAAINPGNSGGALIDTRGQLIGINTAIIFRGVAAFQGVGLAVPISIAERVMNKLLDGGQIERAFLGVTPENLDRTQARRMGLTEPRGALIGSVSPGTPAARSGLEPGDVVLTIDGEPVRDANALRFAVSLRDPGQEVEMEVFRDGRTRSLPVQLAAHPDFSRSGRANRVRPAVAERQPEREWGMSLTNLDEALRRRLDLSERSTGVVVVDVDSRSPAGRAGLEPGDLIKAVERRPVDDVDDLRSVLDGGPQENLLLRVRRGDRSRLLVLEN
ncbi:MAG: Do family serine endopeptidase [Acidobacteriota bacterium]